jgi:ferredoxin
MLIDINEVFDCKLNLIDGIIGMEGNGPTQGEPRYIGAILASRKPYPLDVVACKIIDLDIDNVYTVSESIKRGLTANYDEIILNKPIDDIIIKDYKNILPGKSMEFSEKFKGPFGKIINPIIAKVLTVKPKVKKKECIGCKKCANICPVNAIEMIKKKPVINRDKCIRCFCCQEFCPVGAMKAHKNIIVKILTK